MNWDSRINRSACGNMISSNSMEVDIMKSIGANIKMFRKLSGLTQEKLAEKCNVTRETISKWERGEVSIIADTLVKLAEIFGVSESDIIHGRVREGNEQKYIQLESMLERMRKKVEEIYDAMDKKYSVYEQYSIIKKSDALSMEEVSNIKIEGEFEMDVFVDIGDDVYEKGDLTSAVKYYELALIYGEVYVVDKLMDVHGEILSLYSEDGSKQWQYRLKYAKKMQQYGKIVEEEITSGRALEY